ncbi:MAG: DRTGG domain-containing protein [Anaerolineales bacterium]
MTLKDIIQELDLNVFTDPKNFGSIHPSGGYAADLLSCVMAGAKPGNVWVTLQAHINIVAVAALTEVCAIIISEGSQPEQGVVEKANSQGVTLLGTPMTTYQTAGKLWEMGIH